MSPLEPVAPRRSTSRTSWSWVAFWAVLLVVFLVAVVRAVVDGDGSQALLSGLFLLSSTVWLVRTWWSRQDAS